MLGIVAGAPAAAFAALLTVPLVWWAFIPPFFEFMRGFGASAPAPVLYREFGITPQSVAEAARRAIARARKQ